MFFGTCIMYIHKFKRQVLSYWQKGKPLGYLLFIVCVMGEGSGKILKLSNTDSYKGICWLKKYLNRKLSSFVCLLFLDCQELPFLAFSFWKHKKLICNFRISEGCCLRNIKQLVWKHIKENCLASAQLMLLRKTEAGLWPPLRTLRSHEVII